MKIHNFLAFDLGATSGRAVLATMNGVKFEMQELLRFPNAIMELHGKFYWDIFSLYKSLKQSLAICAEKQIKIDSIGIDTWGVDFAYIGADGTILGLPRAYRDSYTEGKPEEYFKIVSRKEVYDKTGIQIMNFNSLYQLFAAKQEGYVPLEKADKILFMPDLLSYMLTGKQVCEYTDASTSQILNPKTKKFESSLLEAIGINPSLLHEPIFPGTVIGELTDALASETGVGKVPVVAVAGHDTASAVAAVPARNKNFAYLSSGTWSLMGIETEEPIINEISYRLNFTNEGGIEGTTRFLKNITGMWLLEECRKEWQRENHIEYTYPQIVEMAEAAEPFRSLVNPDDPEFANPHSMTQAICAYCERTGQPAPDTHSRIIRCIFESLALRYRQVLGMLQEVSPFPIDCLHVIGGGSKNNLLNQLTANSIGKPVIAGPSEATAIGNVMVQAKAMGLVDDRMEMRKVISECIETVEFVPQDVEIWNTAYGKYLQIVTK